MTRARRRTTEPAQADERAALALAAFGVWRDPRRYAVDLPRGRRGIPIPPPRPAILGKTEVHEVRALALADPVRFLAAVRKHVDLDAVRVNDWHRRQVTGG